MRRLGEENGKGPTQTTATDGRVGTYMAGVSVPGTCRALGSHRCRPCDWTQWWAARTTRLPGPADTEHCGGLPGRPVYRYGESRVMSTGKHDDVRYRGQEQCRQSAVGYNTRVHLSIAPRSATQRKAQAAPHAHAPLMPIDR